MSQFPDFGPIAKIPDPVRLKAADLLVGFETALRTGHSFRDSQDLDIMNADEVAIVSSDECRISTFRGPDSLTIAMSRQNETDHLVIDARLIEAVGIQDDEDGARGATLWAIELAKAVFDQASGAEVLLPQITAELQRQVNLSAAAGGLGHATGVHPVGPDPAAPIIDGQIMGLQCCELLNETVMLPLLEADFNGGPFGATIEIRPASHSATAPEMDTLTRLRLLLADTADGRRVAA